MKNKGEQEFTDFGIDVDSEKELKKCIRKNEVKRIFKIVMKCVIKSLCAFLLVLGVDIIMDVIGIPNQISTLVSYAMGFYFGYLLTI